MSKINTSIILPQPIKDQLDRRPGATSAKIANLLADVFAIMNEGKASLANLFPTADERAVLIEAHAMLAAGTLTSSLQTKIAHLGLAEKHNIDRQAIVAKLDALDLAEQLALRDALDQYQAANGTQPKDLFTF